MSAQRDASERFSAVPALAGTGSLRAGISEWIGSPALSALVAEFSHRGETMPSASLPETLAWLDEFSARWDYRAGKERNLAAETEFDEEVTELVLAAADALGLRGAHPPAASRYDYVLILGGLVRACIARPLHAAALLSSGDIAAARVVALGGYRALGGNELPLARTLELDEHNDEFDVMDAGVRRAFALQDPVRETGENSDVVGASWRARDYETSDGLQVSVVAAPSSEPGVRRANTPDTYGWFASEVAHLKPGQRLLIVTTAIYVPFQHANALRMFALPYGAVVDTVGVDPGEVDPGLAQTFLPHQYLQEVRSAIRALRELNDALPTSAA